MDDAELGRIRVQAQDLSRKSQWAAVMAMIPQLRQDTQFWVGVWAPTVAMAARQLGDPSARGYLDEAISGGFCQPEIFDEKLEEAFGNEPDWTDLVAAMAANVSPAPLELLDWPELSMAHPLRLNEIAPERLDALRARLPRPQPSAWDTATALLGWVSKAWEHTSTMHVDRPDALYVLERVAAGERFACSEYTIVLSQALNALGIAARSVGLLVPNHYTGTGRAHAVTEAWIDDLRSWVVLDGQNGMYWTDSDGRPLGLEELCRRQRAGEPPASVRSLADKASAERRSLWWPHFHYVNTKDVAFFPAPFSPIMEDRYVYAVGELRRDDMTGWYPDLLEVGIGITEVDTRPALRPVTRHPQAREFEISFTGRQWRLPLTDGAWPIPTDIAGEHTLTIATVTDFGSHGSHPVRFVVR